MITLFLLINFFILYNLLQSLLNLSIDVIYTLDLILLVLVLLNLVDQTLLKEIK